MSAFAVAWAYTTQVEPPTRKFVLVAMAERVGDDLSCYPDTKRLALETGLTEPTVKQHINALEDDLLLVGLGYKAGSEIRQGWKLNI